MNSVRKPKDFYYTSRSEETKTIPYDKERVDKKIEYLEEAFDRVQNLPNSHSFDYDRLVIRLATHYKNHHINGHATPECVEKGVYWLDKALTRNIPDAFWATYNYIEKDQEECFFPEYAAMFAEHGIYDSSHALVRGALLGQDKAVGMVINAIRRPYKENNMDVVYTLHGFGFEINRPLINTLYEIIHSADLYDEETFDKRRALVDKLHSFSAYHFEDGLPTGRFIIPSPTPQM